MKSNQIRNADVKPPLETNFYRSREWCVELGRHGDSLCLIYYQNDGDGCKTKAVDCRDSVLCPPEEDEITRHMRLPKGLAPYDSISELLSRVEGFFNLCLDIDERHRFLLACFVLSTWVVDLLPVAPYIALVGPPGSGKSTALRALYLVCRRSLITADVLLQLFIASATV